MIKSTAATAGEVVLFPTRSVDPKPVKRDPQRGSVTRENAKKPKKNMSFDADVSRIRVTVDAPCHARPERDEGGIAAFREWAAHTSEAELRRRYPGEAESFKRILADHRASKCDLYPDWRTFKGFILGVGPMGQARRTLDRINNDDPEYAPGKVRWATDREQANNRSTTTTLRGPDGTVRPLAEWARITGQKPNTMRVKRKRGWRDEEIVAGKRGVPTAPSGGTTDDPWHRTGWPKGVTPTNWNDAFSAFRNMEKQVPAERPLIPRKLRAGLTRAVLIAYVMPGRIGRIHDLTLRRFPELENPDPHAPMPSPEALAAFAPQAALPRYRAALDDALAMIGDDPVQRNLLGLLHDRRERTFAHRFATVVGPFLPPLRLL
jgi:hypothetical protein